MHTLYLIFSHDHQEQLARLARAIRRLSPEALIAIHHDPGRATLSQGLFSGLGEVHVIPNPVRGEWGDYSLVDQYLHAMRWCMDNLVFDWLCTLTGFSYPIKPLHSFEDWLAKSDYDAFVYHFDAFDPEHWPKGTGERRYLFAYYKLPRFPYYYRFPAPIREFLSRARTIFNRMQPLFRIIPMPRGARTRFGIRRLRLPFGPEFKICGGRQMLNINRRTLDRIFHFLTEKPSYVAYARRTLIPDESFFTSIVANDPDLRVCNEVLRYIKWPRDKQDAANGAVITSDDVNEVLQSGAPLALKFDTRVDPSALDMIDAFLDVTESHPFSQVI